MSSWKSSGSRVEPSAVEPTRSQKNAVIWRRSASGLVAADQEPLLRSRAMAFNIFFRWPSSTPIFSRSASVRCGSTSPSSPEIATATITTNDITGGLPNRTRPALTREQVFRLLRCAIKDDEELVDEIIEQVHENMLAFDDKRAECVIELIVRRSVSARWAFRSLLKDMGAGAGARTASPLLTAKRRRAAIGQV